ncbi:12633_t:CDS:2, partial [Funneliformis caledonium]
KVFIEERKVVKDKDVIKILANPNDYSLEDILKLVKKKLKGVSEKLKEKEEVSSLEKDSDSLSEKETPLSTPQGSSIPKNINKDKNIYEFNKDKQKAFSLSDLEQLNNFLFKMR